MGRWFRIIDLISKSRMGLPAETLAERGGWPIRTVFRDLRGLEDAGFPLVSEAGRWRFVDGSTPTFPFPLSAQERLALHVARLGMQPLRGTRFMRDYEAILDRIGAKGAGTPPQGQLFSRLQPSVSGRSQLAVDYSRQAALLETICAACEQGRTMRAGYFVQARQERTTRDLDPYHIHFDPALEALYVFAWCHLRKEMRTFALHRFLGAVLSDKRFTIPSKFSVEGYLGGAFRIWRGENTVRVRLRLGPDAGWVVERRWHASQSQRRLVRGGWELQFQVDGTVELRRFILGLGATCEVMEPTSLRNEIAAEHAQAAGLATRPLQETLSLDVSGVGESGGA